MKTPIRILLTQSDLFQPRPTRPVWRRLPPETRSRVVELLVQLLREHRRAHVAAPRGREAGDE